VEIRLEHKNVGTVCRVDPICCRNPFCTFQAKLAKRKTRNEIRRRGKKPPCRTVMGK
jgi:hypothetical protein